MSFMMLLHDCRSLGGSRFPVNTTNSCPKNKTEWFKRSVALNCNETNGYMCIPNEELTVLLEFCYILPKVPIPKGVCLFLSNDSFVVDAYVCQNFSSGCPDNHYLSDTLYNYQSCVSIGEGRFLAESHYGIESADIYRKKDSMHPDRMDRRKNLITMIIVIVLIVFAILTLMPFIVIADSCKKYFKMWEKILPNVQFGVMNSGLDISKELVPIMTETT